SPGACFHDRARLEFSADMDQQLQEQLLDRASLEFVGDDDCDLRGPGRGARTNRGYERIDLTRPQVEGDPHRKLPHWYEGLERRAFLRTEPCLLVRLFTLERRRRLDGCGAQSAEPGRAGDVECHHHCRLREDGLGRTTLDVGPGLDPGVPFEGSGNDRT